MLGLMSAVLAVANRDSRAKVVKTEDFSILGFGCQVLLRRTSPLQSWIVAGLAKGIHVWVSACGFQEHAFTLQ